MNATSEATRSQAGSSPLGNPWVQLIIGVTCMVMIANLQYGWTLFVGPIDAKYHWAERPFKRLVLSCDISCTYSIAYLYCLRASKATASADTYLEH